MVAHPESRQCLRGELARLPALGKTGDGKRIALYDYRANDALLREIGRLRELTCRQVELTVARNVIPAGTAAQASPQSSSKRWSRPQR